VEDDNGKELVRQSLHENIVNHMAGLNKNVSMNLNTQMLMIIPGQEEKGVNLDFIQQKRTSDNIRRGFLSRLTYDKIWLTPA
jgi:hypothetical protein